MSTPPQAVVGAGSPATDDGLRLPRPPGVVRGFWARHPLAADIVIALVALLLTGPPAVLNAPTDDGPTGVETAVGRALIILAVAALLLRRRYPVIVFAVGVLPVIVLPTTLAGTALLTPAIALYAVAVYASTRACWISYGAATGTLVLVAAVRAVVAAGFGPDVTVDISAVALLLIGALAGVNVGGRKRYVAALIARSQQLLVERDQQARLAAAAERTRIAREMHDIVSHSLTVIVALTEGAAATRDVERARSAARGAADTARAALTEMRAMLGVLRDTDEAVAFAPDTPPDPHTLATTAQDAGYPVTLAVRGEPSPLSATALFALGRVVQEGLTNAMRHARDARSIRILIDYGVASAVVTVEDDGVVPERRPSGGFGLTGLRERLALAGGTLEAGPLAIGGWRVRAVIPRSADSDRDTRPDTEGAVLVRPPIESADQDRTPR